jgi:hypothetical protein
VVVTIFVPSSIPTPIGSPSRGRRGAHRWWSAVP